MDVSSVYTGQLDFNSNLKQGDLLRIRIQKHLGGDRYSIGLEDQSIVVESKIKLQTQSSYLAEFQQVKKQFVLKLLNYSNPHNGSTISTKGHLIALLESNRIDLSDDIISLLNTLDIPKSLDDILSRPNKELNRRIKHLFRILDTIDPGSKPSFFQFAISFIDKYSFPDTEQLLFFWDQFWNFKYQYSSESDQRKFEELNLVIQTISNWLIIPLDLYNKDISGFLRIRQEKPKPRLGGLDLKLDNKDIHVVWDAALGLAWINSDMDINNISELISIFKNYKLRFIGITKNIYFNGFSSRNDADIIKKIDILW